MRGSERDPQSDGGTTHFASYKPGDTWLKYSPQPKHIVCYSGGHSSSLVAIEVYRRFGNTDLILLNHDIHPRVEDADIKRFKVEIANHIGIPITYANMDDWSELDQFDTVVKAGAFKVGNGQILCTNRMKTAPFEKFLNSEVPDKNCIIYYGFDKDEGTRIRRRQQIMGVKGYKTGYPLAHWERTIFTTLEIGIKPPMVYGLFRHANCTGCLKAGKQHWYVVYRTRKDLWEKVKWAELEIGHTLFGDIELVDLEEKFRAMEEAGIEPTERISPQKFWATAKKRLADAEEIEDRDNKPCECIF